MDKKGHTLVVGAGLSGLCVAIHLIQRGERVTVIDHGTNHSSAVAAGMINPLVFRRMTKSWRVDAFLPYLETFYRALEAETKTSLFHAVVIRRMFSNEHERELWLQKQENPDFAPYMERVNSEDDSYALVKNNFGSGRVRQSAYIATQSFLNAAKNFVRSRGTILEERFDFEQLQGNVYKQEPYERVIFCEGYEAVKNPHFNYLPLTQTKGETLTIHSKTLPDQESVNRKCFVLPLGQGQFKIGSTYVWNTADTMPTESGRETILENLAYLTDESVSVDEQLAGIRPTTLDRRPLIGKHPEIPVYSIFNGLGAKGYMLAPLLSREFVAHLLDGTPLDPEVSIQRFAQAKG